MFNWFSFFVRRLTVVALMAGLWSSGCMTETEELGDGGDDGLGVTSQEITYSGHDYLFVTTPKTWHEAQSYCANYDRVNGGGYHLVTIDDSAEESFLNTIEIRRGLSRWWIGYSDQGVEGSWIWSHGYSTHANWAPNQPDNRGEQDCAVDRFDGVDGWDDQPCGWGNVFICERESISSGNRGYVDYSAWNTNNATVGATQYSVYLFAGQLFSMGTCGVPGASGVGDTWLRLKNPSGGEIASNDDSGGACGLLSNISIVAPTTGTYTIHAGCFSNNSCSGRVAFNY